MNDNIIERVARAIYASQYARTTHTWDGASEEQRKGYRLDARAAIGAMREPTEVMVDAGWDVSSDERHIVEATWAAMLDNALAEGNSAKKAQS